MPPAQLCFIVSEPTTLSKADNQRRRMKALSHAAIVSYTRRNPANKGWIQVATAPSFAPSAQSRKNCQLPSRDKRNGSNNGSPEFTKGEQHSQQAQSKRDDLCSHGWLDTAVCEELDPFLKTAFALSRRERSLLHQYLFTAPAYVYGTQSGSLFCIVRDLNVPQIQHNQLWLQWTLLFAETLLHRGDEHQKAVNLLTRRAKLYAFIKELISDPNLRYSESTMMGLAFGSLIEWQVESLEVAQRHLGFVRHTLLSRRGPLRTISFSVGFYVTVMQLWVGLGPYAFLDGYALDTTVDQLVKIISAMQQWTVNMPIYCPRGSSSSQLKGQAGLTARIRRHWVIRHRVLGARSTLNGFLGPADSPNASYFQHSLTLLWLINKMLWELRDDLDMSEAFLETLHKYVESHDSISSFSSHIPQTEEHLRGSGLKPFTVVALVEHISSFFLPKHNPNAIDWTSLPGLEPDRPLLRFWENVNMMEALNLLSSTSRYRIARQLSAWLIGLRPGDSFEVIKEDEFLEYGNEIGRNWIKQANGRNL